MYDNVSQCSFTEPGEIKEICRWCPCFVFPNARRDKSAELDLFLVCIEEKTALFKASQENHASALLWLLADPGNSRTAPQPNVQLGHIRERYKAGLIHVEQAQILEAQSGEEFG